MEQVQTESCQMPGFSIRDAEASVCSHVVSCSDMSKVKGMLSGVGVCCCPKISPTLFLPTFYFPFFRYKNLLNLLMIIKII